MASSTQVHNNSKRQTFPTYFMSSFCCCEPSWRASRGTTAPQRRDGATAASQVYVYAVGWLVGVGMRGSTSTLQAGGAFVCTQRSELLQLLARTYRPGEARCQETNHHTPHRQLQGLLTAAERSCLHLGSNAEGDATAGRALYSCSTAQQGCRWVAQANQQQRLCSRTRVNQPTNQHRANTSEGTWTFSTDRLLLARARPPRAHPHGSAITTQRQTCKGGG